MTDERRVQIEAEVDTTRTRAGFNEIGQQANQMANQVTQAGERAGRANANVGAGASNAAQRAEAAQRNLIGSIQRTTAAMQSGSRTSAQYFEQLARQRGVDPATLQPYLNQLRAIEQAQNRTGASSAQTANALRMVPAQLGDIASQLVGGQSPLLILMQQGSQLRDSFGSVSGALRGVGSSVLGLVNPMTIGAAAALALGLAYNQGSKEADAYNRALVMTNNAAGTNAGQLADYAREISKVVGTQGDAAAALAALAATGQVGTENLQKFGLVAVQANRSLGRSVDDTVKDFADLAKSPVEASLKLSETYHYLTGAVYAQIKALQDQGKADEAAELAQKAYSDAMSERTSKMEANLGSIEKAWRTAKESAASAWDTFLGVGRKKTTAQALAEVREQIALAKSPAPTGGGDRGDAEAMRRARAAEDLPALERKEKEYQAKLDKEISDAAKQAADEKLRQADLDFQKLLAGTRSKTKQLQDEIERVTALGKAAGAKQDDIDKVVAKVKSDFATVDNPLLAQLEGQRAVQREVLAGQLADLESNRKRLLISEADYINKRRDIQLQELDSEINLLKQRAAVDKGKEDKSAYSKGVAELQAAMLRRVNIINAAALAISDADGERKKAVDNLVAGWDRTIAAEAEAVGQELSLFGQSSRARQVAVAQLRIEAEARKFLDDQKRAGKELTKEEIENLDKISKARQKEVAAEINQRAAAAGANQLLEENRQFGIEYLADERQRAAKQLAIDAEKWQELLRNAGEGTEAQKVLQQQYDEWYRNQLLKPQLAEQRRIWESIEQTAHDTFVSIFDSGKSAFDRLRDTLKNGLLDLLYQMTIKKWIISVQADVASSIAGQAASGTAGSALSSAGNLGSIGNLVSTGKSIYSSIVGSGAGTGIMATLSNGVGQLGTMFGSNAVQSFAHGMAGFAPTGAGAEAIGVNAGWAQAGSYASTAAGVLGGVAGGIYGGRFISGGYGSNSAVNTGTAIGAAVGSIVPVLGTALGALVGGLVGGTYNRLFGRKAPEVEKQGIRGLIGADGDVSGQFYQDLVAKGGVFRSDKHFDNDRGLNDQEQSQIGQAFLAITDASSALAKSLGLGADALSGYTKAFDITFTDDAAKNQEAIEKFFGGVADEVAGKLVPNLASFSQSGESASATLQRLAGEFDATTAAVQSIGKTAADVFGDAGIASAGARERLVQIAGGGSALTSLTAAYAQNYLTEAERLAPVAKALDEALGKLGLSSIPTTRAEFKKLVDGLDLTNEAQAKQFVSLMQLQDAYALVHPETAAKEIEATAARQASLLELQAQIYELTGDKAGAAAVLQQQHAAALAALDPALRGATQQLWDLQAAAKESEAAAARQASLLELQAQIYELTGNKAGAAAVLQQQHAAALAALDPALRGATQQLWDLQAAAKASDLVKSDATALLGGVDNAFAVLQKVVEREKKAVQSSVDAHTASVAKLQSLAQALHGTLDSLKSPDQRLADRALGQAQIRAALAIAKAGGPLPDADKLKDALSAVQQDASSQFSTYDDYLRDLYQTQNDIGALAGLADDSLSVEQKALQAAQDQLAALDAVLARGQEQIDVLKGQSTTLLSIDQGIAALSLAIKSAQQNPVISATSDIAAAYQSALGRAPDAAGLQFWQNQAAAGTPTSAIVDGIKNSEEAKKRAAIQQLYQQLLGRKADDAGLGFFASNGASLSAIEAAIKTSDEYKRLHAVPGFALGGLHAGGLRIVGENGPELEATGPSRIWSSNQTAALLARAGSGTNDALVAEVKMLRATSERQQALIERQEELLQAIAGHTSETSSHLDDVVNGRKPVVTEPA